MDVPPLVGNARRDADLIFSMPQKMVINAHYTVPLYKNEYQSQRETCQDMILGRKEKTFATSAEGGETPNSPR